MILFRLDTSIRTAGSHSRRLAGIVQAEWEAARPDEAVVNREIGIDPLPSDGWAAAVSSAMVWRTGRRWHRPASFT